MTLLALIVALFVLSLGARAAGPGPKWVPEKGYWVVETNIHVANKAVVYFYNLKNELVYQEAYEGRLNLDRRRVLVRLNRVLEQAVAAWEQKTPSASPAQLLARQLAD